MSGTVFTITSNPSNITSMTCLEERPVFFLKLHGSMDVNLVVKGEGDGASPLDAHAPESIKWGSKLMKNVNNTSVNTKMMAPAEIAAFKMAGLLMIPQTFVRPRLNLQTPGPPYTWTKMAYVPGLSSAEFWKEDNTTDAKRAKANVTKMSDEAFWADLGKVVAVDIFNGNCDRFDITSGFWQNKGNIMYLAGGQTSVIGLDTFDPNAQGLHDLTTAIDFGNIAMRRQFQHLLYLVDPGERLKFARECVKSVGSELRRAFKKVDSFTVPIHGPDGDGILRVKVAQMDKLFEDFVPVFAQGIADGATQLKLHLQNKVRQYAAQQPQQPPGRGRLQIGAGHRGMPQPQRAPVQPQQAQGKTIPQGILDRMGFLRWLI